MVLPSLQQVPNVHFVPMVVELSSKEKEISDVPFGTDTEWQLFCCHSCSFPMSLGPKFPHNLILSFLYPSSSHSWCFCHDHSKLLPTNPSALWEKLQMFFGELNLLIETAFYRLAAKNIFGAKIHQLEFLIYRKQNAPLGAWPSLSIRISSLLEWNISNYFTLVENQEGLVFTPAVMSHMCQPQMEVTAYLSETQWQTRYPNFYGCIQQWRRAR
jgi:hypothetical protein